LPLQVGHFGWHKTDTSSPIPLSPTRRDYNHLPPTPDSKTHLGLEGEIPKVQNRPSWLVVVLVYSGGDCNRRYGPSGIARDGNRVKSVRDQTRCGLTKRLFPKLPLFAGVLITAADSLIILLFFRSDHGRQGMVFFEVVIVTLVSCIGN
jgi:hypothetical protein